MASVENTVRAYFDALNLSDTEAVVALFAEDGSLLGDESPTATGHEQLRRAYEEAFREIRFQREVRIDRIREGSDVAVARTHTTGTLTFRAVNDTITTGSRELFVLRRSGADWLITEYMSNRPGPH